MIKVVKYNDEKWTVRPTASYAGGAGITVEVKNGVMFIDYIDVVSGLPPKTSVLYAGPAFKYKIKPMRTVGDLSSGNQQYGFIGVSIDINGRIVIYASNAPASPLELRFSIVTPIQ